MPNRVLRDWTASELVDTLTPEAEVFFTRLIMKADDYGSYYANPKLIKSALFPLKDYTSENIQAWIAQCIDAKLITAYSVEGKEYIKIKNFGQRLRAMRNTFPQPADNPLTSGGQLADYGRPETKRNETETKQKGNEPDFQVFDKWGKDIIDGNDFIFSQRFRNEFPNWGGPEKLVEVVNDHFDMLNRYPKMNPNTQERFRNSLIKHFREYKSKSNGTANGHKKGIDVNTELQLINDHIKSGQRK